MFQEAKIYTEDFRISIDLTSFEFRSDEIAEEVLKILIQKGVIKEESEEKLYIGELYIEKIEFN